MTPAHEQPGIAIHHGDCLDVMAALPPASVDTIVTDPPYGLSFMGKGWDHGVPGVPYWTAALRVAKSGAMLLAFGGTRTYHRLACCIEDAGWEIRDCLMWLYGSGFPKSHDISKGIDKAAGALREVVGRKSGGGVVSSNSEGWDRPWKADPAARERAFQITSPATDAAREWSGWGTALKPAWEPIILAMKPTDGTFAENALRHGVAGLNIDGGRIAGVVPVTTQGASSRIYGGGSGLCPDGLQQSKPHDGGRWPANVILDEEAGRLLDRQSGTLASGTCPDGYSGPYKADVYGKYARNEIRPETVYGDSGGASRFFYCPKAAGSERGQENTHPTVKPLDLMRYLVRLTKTPTGGVVLDPFSGSFTTGLACVDECRGFIGIERERQYVDIGIARIRRHTEQGRLFGASA